MSELDVEILLDQNGKDLAVRHSQDVEPILEFNKILRAEDQKSDWGRHVAEIPNVIYVRWLDEEYAKGNTNLRLFTPEFDAIVQKKLRDPEWAHLRTDKKPSFLGWDGVPIGP